VAVEHAVELDRQRRRHQPWAASPITTRAEVERARQLVDDLALRRLEPLLDQLEKADASLVMPHPGAVREWAERLALWRGIRDTLELFEPALFDLDLAALSEQLTPLGEGLGARLSATMSDSGFRAAHKQVKELQREGVKLRKAALHEAVHAASDQHRRWRDADAQGTPRPPDGPRWVGR